MQTTSTPSVQQAEAILDSLTAAQCEVLDRVVLHQTSKEIARELGIAPNTVDQRLKSARKKLNTIDRASTARRYTLLKTICGRTIYGSSAVDESIFAFERDVTESASDALFRVEDASAAKHFYWERQGSFLEALDARFGRLGRVGAVLLAALTIVLIILVVTSISVTLGALF